MPLKTMKTPYVKPTKLMIKQNKTKKQP